MKIKNKLPKNITANEFNENFNIVVKKDFLTYKAGQELCLKDTTIVVDNSKLPGILTEEQIQQAKLWRQEVPPKPFRWIAKQFNLCHTTVERAVKK